MVSLSALHRDNPDNLHITTCHTMKSNGRTYVAEEHITLREHNAPSPRKRELSRNDCQGSGQATLTMSPTNSTEAGDNSEGGEVGEADTVSSNSGPVIQCRRK